MKLPLITGDYAFTQRKRLALNQTDYWRRVGVTQSGGSRYESGRDIPRPVQMLLTLAYGTNKQAQFAFDQLRNINKQEST